MTLRLILGVGLIAAGVLVPAGPAAAQTITVNDGDEVAIATDGFCTLREAITSANSNTASGGVAGECPAGTGASDTIDFNIAGAGPHTILLGSALPSITAPVTIDGYCPTCDGATPATATSPAVIKIAIDGNTVTGDGINIDTGGSGSTIKGLAIFDFNGDPIQINGTDNNVISGNHIAVGVSGLTGAPCNDGLTVQTGSTNNLIGGSTPADRNVIGGCTSGAVLINGVGANMNTVAGNYIGIGADGTSPLASADSGVAIAGSADQNTIGGATVGHRNVIASAPDGVIVFGSGTDGNSVLNNYIGTTAAGAEGGSVANGIGVSIGGGALATQVSDNLIAFNATDGVRVMDATTADNPISRNSIHSNGDLGIDLGNDGVTENDGNDSDPGANGLQNFPVLQRVFAGPSMTTFQGTLSSEASTTYLLHFYANSSCDPSGNGEGERFIGAVNMTTDAGGNASFTSSVAGTASPGEAMTATVTEQGPGGETLNTSEFSDCLTAEGLSARDVELRAKPKRLEEGKKTRLTAELTSCVVDSVVEFQRKKGGALKTVRTVTADDCDATTRVKVKRTTSYFAHVPADSQFVEDTSNKVRVRIKNPD